nr:putative glycine-rich cell wall structural protein 1 [Nicotiana tomentosiformis]
MQKKHFQFTTLFIATMASQRCIPLILWLFISLSLGSAHRVLLEPTKAEKPENTQNPIGVTKPSSGGGGFGWGWGSDGNNNGGGGGGGSYGSSCGSGNCNQPGIPGYIPPGIGVPGGGGGGYGGSCGSGNCNQPGTPGWIHTPGIGVPGGVCNCPTPPIQYPCPYGCQPPGFGCIVGNAKQTDKEKQDGGDQENGNREEQVSPNFEKHD